MTRRKATAVLVTMAAAAWTAVPAASASADMIVCNEAQSSWQGVLDASGSTDPLPPARHKDAAMEVGQGHGKGLLNAADNSPALAVCSAGDWGGGT